MKIEILNANHARTNCNHSRIASNTREEIMTQQEFVDKIFAEMKDISEQLLANNKEMLALYKEKELIVNTMRRMLSEAGYNSDRILNDLQHLINDHQENTVDKHNEA